MKIMFKGEPAEITHWLIRADQPFNGSSQSYLLPDGTIAYTNGLTPRAYAKERGFPVRVITDAELDALMKEHESSLITDPKEESESDWWHALEVLPPCKWRHINGVELFHISERLTADLVSWHARFQGRYYTFTDKAGRKMSELANKVRSEANV